jgi:hypothetical protein
MRSKTQEYAGEAAAQTGRQDVNRAAPDAATRASSDFGHAHPAFQFVESSVGRMVRVQSQV